jgi:hypothetical protein
VAKQWRMEKPGAEWVRVLADARRINAATRSPAALGEQLAHVLERPCLRDQRYGAAILEAPHPVSRR